MKFLQFCDESSKLGSKIKINESYGSKQFLVLEQIVEQQFFKRLIIYLLNKYIYIYLNIYIYFI